jgi:hypothetical protein
LTSATRPEFWLEIVEQCYEHLQDEQLRRRFERYLEHDDEMRFTTVRRLLRRVRDANLQVVCALDEFECLAENELFTPTFYGELRSLASEMGVVYLTASRRSLYDLTYHNETQRTYLTTYDVQAVLKTIIERGKAHFTSGPAPRRKNAGYCWALPNTWPTPKASPLPSWPPGCASNKPPWTPRACPTCWRR